MKKIGVIIFLAAVFSCSAWEFKGKNDGMILSWRPEPGRFAVTAAFQFTVSAQALTPGNRPETAFYPLVMNAVKPGKGEFKGVTMGFVTKHRDRYCFVRVNGGGGRFNIHWNNVKSEIPVGKPVWVFILAGSGSVFDLRINKRCFSDVLGDRPLDLYNSAREYRFYLGYNPWRGGVGFMECKIENFMLFDRTLSRREMEMIENNPAVGAELPGYCRFTAQPFVSEKRKKK